MWPYLIVSAALILVSTSVMAGPFISTENCFITTTSQYKDGTTKKKTSSFSLKTKADCQQTKKLLSENFDPQRIKSVTAKMEWRGK